METFGSESAKPIGSIENKHFGTLRGVAKLIVVNSHMRNRTVWCRKLGNIERDTIAIKRNDLNPTVPGEVETTSRRVH
jgi:hypothetical protein